LCLTSAVPGLDVQVLPLGVSDIPQKHNVKVFCPKCCDLYSPRSRRRSGTLTSYHTAATVLPRTLSADGLVCCPSARPARPSWTLLSFQPVNAFVSLRAHHMLLRHRHGRRVPSLAAADYLDCMSLHEYRVRTEE
jgi:hypothetical protein